MLETAALAQDDVSGKTIYVWFRFTNKEAIMEIANRSEITTSEISTGILMKSTNDIFRPTNTRIAARAYLR